MAIPITLIDEGECLALYVVDEADALNEGQLKGDFFVPTPNKFRENRLEKFVIRHGNRNLEQMKKCGKDWADSLSKSFLGLANISAKDVRSVASLNVVHTPRRKETLHSDIVDWDSNIIFQRVQSEEIARKAKFINAQICHKSGTSQFANALIVLLSTLKI